VYYAIITSDNSNIYQQTLISKSKEKYITYLAQTNMMILKIIAGNLKHFFHIILMDIISDIFVKQNLFPKYWNFINFREIPENIIFIKRI